MTAPDLPQADTETPNPARMYDYYLGGAHNFAADRAAAEQVLSTLPQARAFARDNRGFLRRAVRHLVREAGIKQFLDLGSGIPTVGNVHEIAQRDDPDCTVVYVDCELVAYHTARRMLDGNATATILHADLRDPSRVLSHADTQRLIDFTQPVAVLIVSVLPFIADADDPAGVIATYRDVCGPGSYLALSHSLSMRYWPEGAEEAAGVYRNSNNPLHLRDPEQIETFFAGYDLVEPGLTLAAEWRPDSPPAEQPTPVMAGLGKLRVS